MTLSLSDFDAFHREVHRGFAPFDWQKRLLAQIVQERCWPGVLDLPTGAGKTTCIDIALFALALDAQSEPSKRWCPRRIAMVVDRRLVVDQVAERGRKLAKALAAPTKGTKADQVAIALRKLRGDHDDEREPVGVFTLRGGMPKDDGWARSPDQPLILASTVDQIGSRLLVQGYGVSPGMKPVHAGLIGNDTLILLDEVHLSKPFADTLNDLASLRERWANEGGCTDRNGLPRRSQVAFLSATPGDSKEAPFALLETERREDSPLGARLHVHKAIKLEDADDRAALEERCDSVARSLLKDHDVIAVVVNRVASASKIANELRAKAGDVDVVLLTGRMRPLDRDDVLRELRRRIETGRERGDGARKLIVVGTQCIEAGADFDFDAMVTEGASLDALRQRFGRLDRLGTYKKSVGVIVFDKTSKKDDPVYGEALSETSKWLKSQVDKKAKVVDFGIQHLVLPEADVLAKLVAPKKSAPVLLPAYLDLWMQTSPEPMAVPDIGLWLHGPQSGPADVQIVWRSDLQADRLSNDELTRAIALVGAIRPSSLESISVPFSAARQWLRGETVGEISDVEGVEPSGDERVSESKNGRRALRWRGDNSALIDAASLRPGDTIVVPATYGGIRNNCFEPGAGDGVLDLAERAALISRGQPVLRLNQAVLADLKLSLPTDELLDTFAALERIESDEPSGWRKLWMQALIKGGARRWRPIVVEGGAAVLRGPKVKASSLRNVLDAESQEDGVELTTDEEDSYYAGRSVPLDEHSQDVEQFARRYAEAIGLPASLVKDIALAAWLHDIGKADRRFQLMLRGGSQIDLLKEPTPWAKSAMTPGDKTAQRRAQKLSGYPRGTRHEVQSLAMIDKHVEQVRAKATDIDLVQFLVASHHGYCRPFAPVAVDDKPEDVALDEHTSAVFGTFRFEATTSANQLYRLDSSLADRFWLLVEKYGWLELCWLESILRLADHRASEMEQQKDGEV